MSEGRVAILGEPALIRGWGLAGLVVAGAEDPARMRSRWDTLPDDVGLVLLTPCAAAALTDRIASTERMVVVLP